jgi:hypothetical protein
VIQLPWNTTTRILTSTYGNFGPNDAMVIAFTTGSVPTPPGTVVKILMGEYIDGPATRTATLSPNSCDFSHQASYGANSGGTSVNLPFLVGPSYIVGYYATIPFNSTWYVNVKTVNGQASNNMYLYFLKPGGV